MTQPAPPPQLPLMVSVGGAATDNAGLTPGLFALPVGSVSVTHDLSSTEETLLTGGLIELSGQVTIRGLTIRINVPPDHPVPRLLGEAWAALRPGQSMTVSETYTDRHTRSQYGNARLTANSMAVSRQRSLTESYYSGTLEFRVLIEAPNGL